MCRMGYVLYLPPFFFSVRSLLMRVYVCRWTRRSQGSVVLLRSSSFPSSLIVESTLTLFSIAAPTAGRSLPSWSRSLSVAVVEMGWS